MATFLTSAVAYVVFPAVFGGAAWAARGLVRRGAPLGKPAEEPVFWAGVLPRVALGALLLTELFLLPFHLDVLFGHVVEARVTKKTTTSSTGQTTQGQHVTDFEANQRAGDPQARCRPSESGGQVCDAVVSSTTTTVRATLVWDEGGQPRSHEVTLYNDDERLPEGAVVQAIVGVGNPTIGTQPDPPGCSLAFGLMLAAGLWGWLWQLRRELAAVPRPGVRPV